VVLVTSSTCFVKYVASMSFWAWIAALGVSWLTAFAIQSFAEKPLPGRGSFSFIRYYPKSLDQQKFYDIYIRFRKNASPDEKQQVERLVVIKEACGNGYVAIAISLLLVVVDAIHGDSILSPVAPASSNLWVVVPLLIVAVAVVYYLRQMHFIHVQRQYDYMVQTLNFHESKSASSSTC